MIKSRFVAAGAGVLFAMVAQATTYSPEGLITGMFAGSGNQVGVFHAATWYNPANCPNGAAQKAYLFDYGGTQDMSKVYSTLLAAYIAGKPIRIGVSDTVCSAGYPLIERVAFVEGF